MYISEFKFTIKYSGQLWAATTTTTTMTTTNNSTYEIILLHTNGHFMFWIKADLLATPNYVFAVQIFFEISMH